jgi:hypothetical protein
LRGVFIAGLRLEIDERRKAQGTRRKKSIKTRSQNPEFRIEVSGVRCQEKQTRHLKSEY